MTNETATSPSREQPVENEPAGLVEVVQHAVKRSGGWTGIAVAAAPTLAFVTANALGDLMSAFVALAVTAPAAFGVRLARREPLREALIGLAIAAGCALVAALTGEARGFFLVPTLLPAACGLLFLGSVLAGRPLTGVAVNRLAGGPRDWRQHAPLRRVYTATTWLAAGICFANFVVRAVLYTTEQLALLATVEVAAVPVPFASAALTVAAARSTLRRHPAPAVEQ